MFVGKKFHRGQLFVRFLNAVQSPVYNDLYVSKSRKVVPNYLKKKSFPVSKHPVSGDSVDEFHSSVL